MALWMRIACFSPARATAALSLGWNNLLCESDQCIGGHYRLWTFSVGKKYCFTLVLMAQSNSQDLTKEQVCFCAFTTVQLQTHPWSSSLQRLLHGHHREKLASNFPVHLSSIQFLWQLRGSWQALSCILYVGDGTSGSLRIPMRYPVLPVGV